MFHFQGLKTVVVAGALGTAAMACGGAPDEAPTAPAQTGYIFSAKASTKSQDELGITRWHSTVESGVSNAIVLDGQDRLGKVKYLSTAHVDKKTNTFRVQVILPQKGELVWDIKHQTLLTNTLPMGSLAYAKGIFHDYQLAHPIHGGVQQYTYLSGFGTAALGGVLFVAGLAVIATSAVPIIGQISAPASLTIGGALTTLGGALVKDGMADVKESANQARDTAMEQTNTEVGKVDPAAQAPTTVADAPQATPGEGSPAGTASNAGSPTGEQPPVAGEGAPAPTPTEGTGTPSAPPTELPQETNGGNLDNMGTASASDNTGTPSSDNTGTSSGSDNSGATSGDTGGSGGGGDVGAGGGGGGSSEASHICRKVAVSAKTKIRACVHY
jgi:uncharacterized membrane protein YgcG